MSPDGRLRCGALIAGLALATGVFSCSRSMPDVTPDGTEAVRDELESSPDPAHPNQYGDAVIHSAAYLKDPQMLGVVLDRGVGVDLRNRGNMTALGIAVDDGCVSCVFELLQAHADPNAAQARRGDRPLHIAAAHGSPEMVRMLLDAGADPNGRNKYGETPLTLATTPDGYRAIAVTKVLIERGSDARTYDVIGDTAIHKAATHDAIEIIGYYASIGADLNAPNKWGATPLDRAVDARCDRAVDLLYRLGATSATTRRFEPPLITAARTDDAERARWLLIFGADPKRAFEGKSALDVARANHSDAVIGVLEATARP